MTLDIESITSQEKLNKRKVEKVLKELAFHNGRNLLTVFPIEFIEQNNSGGDDTLVLVFQCNKNVSKDISGQNHFVYDRPDPFYHYTFPITIVFGKWKVLFTKLTLTR